MANNNYDTGAKFERKIIHGLLDMGAVLVLRGAGSKSYGSIKADIVAIFPNGKALIVQAKHSRKTEKQEREAFFEHHIPAVIKWWATPENYKRIMAELRHRGSQLGGAVLKIEKRRGVAGGYRRDAAE